MLPNADANPLAGLLELDVGRVPVLGVGGGIDLAEGQHAVLERDQHGRGLLGPRCHRRLSLQPADPC